MHLLILSFQVDAGDDNLRKKRLTVNKLESDKDVISGQQVFVAYPACPDDEISLVDIWKILYKGKKIIIGSFVAGVLVAAIAVVLLPKIYRAKTVLLPPQLSNVAALSVSGIYKAEPQAIYKEFLINLHSHGLRYQYFRDYLLSDFRHRKQGGKKDDYELFTIGFDKRLKISSKYISKKGGGTDFIAVTLDGENYDSVASWLQKYIAFVDEYTVKKLVTNVHAQLKLQADEIKEQIAFLRLVAFQERQDRIAKLKEAYAIAKRLQIEKPTGSAFVVDEKRKTSSDEKTGIIFSSNEVPLYFRGYLALQGELEQLQNRKSDDSFIVGLRELQGKLSFLEKKQIDSKIIHAVQVDQQARTNNKPIEPKNILIMLFGIVLGAIFGIVVTLITRNTSTFNNNPDNCMPNG